MIANPSSCCVFRITLIRTLTPDRAYCGKHTPVVSLQDQKTSKPDTSGLLWITLIVMVDDQHDLQYYIPITLRLAYHLSYRHKHHAGNHLNHTIRAPQHARTHYCCLYSHNDTPYRL
jgi:hypothetical protein